MLRECELLAEKPEEGSPPLKRRTRASKPLLTY